MIQLQKPSDCVGCHGCMQICPKQCIEMREDHEGFRYPHVDASRCIDCGLCEKVCPVLYPGESRLDNVKAYAAYNLNEEERLQSSSGGVFSLLAKETLSSGGVVFGARFNEKWEVVHASIEDEKDLHLFRGSKYVQSIIGSTYQEAEHYLKEGRQVLFSGTPCQIAGLKRFLRKEYDNLLTVDFICHGVPSPKVWRSYLKNEGIPTSRIKSIQFRDKSFSWENYRLFIQYGKRSCKEYKWQNLFMRGFLADLYLRPSCYLYS